MKIAFLLMCAFMFVSLGTEACLAMGWPPADVDSGGSHSAPGPVIGLGVPAIIAFGGYVWYRRRWRGK